jgi:predicted GNAT family N-acyltransferase
MTVEVVTIEHDQTLALRRAVLRNGDPGANVVWDEDEWPGTMHLGARRDGVLVATSTWIPRPFPEATAEVTTAVAADEHWQLRGMATADGVRGSGVGGILVDAGCARCADRGGRLVWARARDTALVFYARHEFEVVGDGFVDATTGLPHHLVRRTLG